VTTQLRFREAVAMTLHMFAVVAALLVYQIVRVTSQRVALAEVAVQAALLIALCLAMALMFRALFRVKVTPDGMVMSFKKRHVTWSEIASVDHGRVAFGRRGYHLRSLQRETIVVLDSIASDPKFRAAIDAWAPEGHAIRALLSPPT
jgi:hypothetical protein